MKIKALSLAQPHASRVASGEKTLETRVWATGYRGDLLICASRSGQGEPKGVALCVVSLDGIRMMTRADEAAAMIELYPRARAWELSNLRRLKQPFAVKGRLGIFEVEVTPEQLEFEA